MLITLKRIGRSRAWAAWAAALAIAACSTEEELANRPLQLSDEQVAFVNKLKQLHKRERYDEGIELARQQLEASPDAPLIHYILGTLLGSKNNHKGAIDHFRQELNRDPDHYPSLFGVAIAFSNLGQRQQALPYLQRCQELQPDNGDIAFQLGRNLSELGRFEEAEAQLLDAVTRRDSPDTYAELGIVYRRSGRLEEAMEAFRLALARDPRHASSLFNLGQILLQLGRREEGQEILKFHEEIANFNDRLEHYQRASRLPGATADNHVILARLLLQIGDDSGAMKAFQNALNLQPKHSSAALGLASLFLRSGNIDEATKWAVYGLVQDPKNARAYFLLGVIRLFKGQLPEAEEAFSKSRQLELWSAASYGRLGDAYQQQSQFRQAIAAYRQSLAMEPGDAETQYRLAKAYYSLGDADAALQSAQQTIAADTNHADAWILQGILLFNRGDAAQSQQACRQAIRLRTREIVVRGDVNALFDHLADLPGVERALDYCRELASPKSK